MTKQKIGTIGLWVLTALTAAMMAFAGTPKVMGNPMAVEGFAKMGFPSWFLPLIGILEIAGAIGLLIPRLSGLAALGLSFIMVGAVGTHFANHDAAHSAPAIVFLVITIGIAYARRDAWLGFLPVGGKTRTA
jgi:putative oxidoreductase